MGEPKMLAGTVLVVDDQAMIRMFGADMIAEAGYEVIEATSADEALRILENAEGVSLLFSDIDMPGSMDGLALAEIVNKRWPDIRLLLTSGHHKISDEDMPDHGKFLSKPYNSSVVVETIKTLLPDSD